MKHENKTKTNGEKKTRKNTNNYNIYSASTDNILNSLECQLRIINIYRLSKMSSKFPNLKNTYVAI